MWPQQMEPVPHDRSALLADPERPQDHHVPRGDRPALPDRPGRYRPRRAVPARVPGDRPQQPDAGDRRPRAGRRRRAAVAVRVRRHPALSRREDRPVHPGRPARPGRGAAVAVLADGRARADGRAEPPLRHLCAGEAALRDRPLRQRDQPALRRARPAAGRPRVRRRRRLLDRRHGVLSLDRARTSARARSSTTSRISSAGSTPSRPGRRRVRAYEVGDQYRRRDATVDEEAKKVLFGQTAASFGAEAAAG